MPKAKQQTKAGQQMQHNKKVLLEALEKSLGVVTTACKAVNLDRTTHYRYFNDDPEYAKAVADIAEVALDFAESQLHKQIQKGEVSSTIFYLKTKGKHRGYIEKSQTEHSGPGGGPIQTENHVVKIELTDD
jgi:hypothetical protein